MGLLDEDINAQFDAIAAATFTRRAKAEREAGNPVKAQWFQKHLDKYYKIETPEAEQVEIDWYGDSIVKNEQPKGDTPRSVLDVKVSVFKSHLSRTGKEVDLLSFLISDDVKKTQHEYDSAKTDEAKKIAKGKASAITPGGTFAKRETKGLIQPSGLIQFDIDAQDNEEFDPILCRDTLGRQPWCAFSSLSISGKGVWGLALVGADWKGSVKRLMGIIQKLGYKADRAPSNIASLRYLSFDKDAVFNHTPLHLPAIVKRPAVKRTLRTKSIDTEQLTKLCEVCQLRGISLLESETDWYRGGRALATLGEQGRDFFHSLSSVSAKYDPQDADKKYTIALKNANGSITLGTLFQLAKDSGIDIKAL